MMRFPGFFVFIYVLSNSLPALADWGATYGTPSAASSGAVSPALSSGRFSPPQTAPGLSNRHGTSLFLGAPGMVGQSAGVNSQQLTLQCQQFCQQQTQLQGQAPLQSQQGQYQPQQYQGQPSQYPQQQYQGQQYQGQPQEQLQQVTPQSQQYQAQQPLLQQSPQQCQQQCLQRLQQMAQPQSFTPQQLQTQPPASQFPLQPEPQKTENGWDRNGVPRLDILAEPSAVEKMMSGEDRSAYESKKSIPFVFSSISQYGYNFFHRGTEFAPVNDAPVGPEYVIGSGDRIILTAWGSLEGTYELEVNRNGEIVLPKVGPAKVEGVTYGHLPQVLKSTLSRVFKDFHLSVTLGRTRLLKIYLVGEVVAPGDYTITSLSTVINALSAAGGPTKNGTLRNIQVKRGGELVESIDLYDFFLKGDKSRDIHLQAGDTLLVPPLGKVVGIAGNVRQPAIFELKGEKTLKELLALANGVNSTGYLQRIQITRTVPHDKTEVLDFSLDPKLTGKSLDDLTANIAIQDLDYVKVFPIDSTLRGYARLEGYVIRPGDYALRPGMKVSEFLKEDNLLPEYADGIAELVRLHPPDYHPEIIYFSPAKALAGDPADNLELKEFDRLRIFSKWDLEEMPRVRVLGEVQRPGDYRLLKNMTVRELLLQAGNPKLTAYLGTAELVRIKKDGNTVTSFPLTINLGEALKGDPKENIQLESLDELIVRRYSNWLEETERYASIKGEVKFPGTYPIFKGERLSGLIQRAGGYSDKAYLFGAKFTRQSVKKIQQERMEEAVNRMEKDISVKEQSMVAAKEDAASTKMALDGLKKSIEKLKSATAEGRISIRLEPLPELQKGSYDMELMGGDTLEIPQSPMAVSVIGEVASPTSIIWVPERDVSFYLAMSGGPTGNAETDEMYVVMANGIVRGKQSDGLFGGFMSTKLHPGDTVIVPQVYERISWMKEIKDISTILGNLAVTAGVPLAIIKK